MEGGDDRISRRKIEHLRVFEDDPGVERRRTGFDQIHLTHRALPEISFDKVNPSTVFLGKPLSFPLIISSMTGGDGDEVCQINQRLAEAAEATGVAMAVGSQRVMLKSSSARKSFELRPTAPNVPLIGNIGAVQLNEGVTARDCQSAVDVLQADGLYLHLNPLQEAVQPEGDRNFEGLGEAIANVVQELSAPVLLKEVGAGLSAADVALGLSAGIRHFDVAGRGGTSWSRVEYHRRTEENDDIGLVFQDWGLTTVECLKDVVPVLKTSPDPVILIASGGIRNGIDMAKAMILGADMCGMAAPFLEAAKVSTKTVIQKIERTQREFKTAMFLLGCSNCSDLKENQTLLR